MDFLPGTDQIDLSEIDADANSPLMNDSFVYLNGDSSLNPAMLFTGTAGELRSYRSATSIIVEGDVDGDGRPDFAIEIYDPGRTLTLTTADFIGVL